VLLQVRDSEGEAEGGDDDEPRRKKNTAQGPLCFMDVAFPQMPVKNVKDACEVVSGRMDGLVLRGVKQ